MPSFNEFDLPTLDLLSPGYQADPHGSNAAVRAQGWLAKLTIGGVAVMDYSHAKEVLRDRRFHAALTMGLAMQGITSGPLWDRLSALLLSLEGEAHDVLRARLEPYFTTRALHHLQPTLRAAAERAVAAIAPAGKADIVTDVAEDYPLVSLAALLGVAEQDVPRVTALIDTATGVLGPSIGAQASAIEAAFTDLEAYIASEAVARRTNPGNDLISALVGPGADPPVTDAELPGIVESIVLPGVQEPRGQLAAMVQALCDHPDQWDAVASKPELAGAAVDEALRWCPVLIGTFRVPAEDVELDGVTIPAGTVVVVMTASANRDPDVYLEPDSFDITRPSPAASLALGSGIHECLGRHLARLELSEGLDVLANRLGDLKADGPAPWKPLTGVSGPSALPVTFTAR
jgi:cytochrome P450